MRRILYSLGVFVLASALSALSQSTTLRPPSKVTAGTSFNIATTGRGTSTFYLIGPTDIVKRTIEVGQDVVISGDDVTTSGAYQAVACNSEGCASSAFHVMPAAPTRLTFLLHPSRVPVSTSNAVNGTALVSDKFHNTVIAPAKVDFRLSSAGQGESTRSIQTERGIAWFQTGSNPKQGALQVTASLGDTTEPRVIQQVASEACGLRMNASTVGHSVTLQTDPIRDCAGNPLPDGTIVSFTKTDAGGRSTVDTPIKKDKANAKFDVSGPAHISVACGVVLGNEISLGGMR
jgi:hypothetical protein